MNEVRIQSLNGMWLYRIGKGKQREVSVPFSTLAVGHSECECTFTLTETAPCTYLKFDGITYAAKVFLNDIFIGDMLPYSEYLFDVTAFVCDVNALRVELEDIAPAFGPSEGWENFGGIIRDVSVLYAAENRITDVFFHATLQDDYRNAVFTVETTAQIPQGVFHITLFDGDKAVCSYEQAADATAQAKLLCDVRLWDVDTPHLYTLCVALEENGYKNANKTVENGDNMVTYNDWSKETVGRPIDFIFVNDNFVIKNYVVVTETGAKTNVSDHYMIEAILN